MTHFACNLLQSSQGAGYAVRYVDSTQLKGHESLRFHLRAMRMTRQFRKFARHSQQFSLQHFGLAANSQDRLE